MKSPSSLLHSFHLRDDCVTCDSSTPVCTCAADESCVVVGRTCNQCASITCTPKTAVTNGSTPKSVNAGEIAGPTVAGVVLIAVSLVMYILFRRRRARDLAQIEAISRATLKAQSAGFHLPSSPRPGASPSSSQRRDPNYASAQVPTDVQSARSLDVLTFGSGTNEWSHLQRSPQGPLGQPGGAEEVGVRRVYGEAEGSINLDPAAVGGGRSRDLTRRSEGNPFDDRRSIATDAMSFGSTNVIPIAYVPSEPTNEWPPSRPARSPDLNLRIGGGPAAEGKMEMLGEPSARNPRASFQTSRTNHSIAPSFFSSQSDFDVPMILTGKQVQFGRGVPAVVQLDGVAGSAGGGLKVDTRARQVGLGMGMGMPSPGASSARSDGSARSDPFDDRKRAEESPLVLRNGGGGGGGRDDLGPPVPGFAQGGGVTAGEDFRFSMGSLGNGNDRDSISTMGTGRYTTRDVTINEAKKVFVGTKASPLMPISPPTPGTGARQLGPGDGARESMMSGRSDADSFLNSFPIFLPPNQQPHDSASAPPLPASAGARQRIPQSMSGRSIHETMLSAPGLPSNPRAGPPVNGIQLQTMRGDGGGGLGGRERSNSEATSRSGKRATAGSGMSEGLGGFEFAFGGTPPVPRRG